MVIEELNGRPLRLLIGGSPCTHWSIAQKNNRETKPEGLGWELFKNYLIAKEKFKPDFFLYENNKSAAQQIKDQISKELGADLQYINSALVSAQNRQRFYAHNIPSVEQPEDRGILLIDILESGATWLEKSHVLTTRCNGAIISDTLKRHRHTMVVEPVRSGNIEIDGKLIYRIKDGYIWCKNEKYEINLPDGYYTVRKLTPIECERLQTLPDNYTSCPGVSNSQRYKMIGNGWTAEIIIHILSHVNIPKDYPIEVLSMYDGIATGRYCLAKLGYTNIIYKAYEIDEFAKKVAMKNYPDIIQCGDAFQVRESDWKY